ncbi:hypothetical protein AJ79_04770 [Helicocarpus griseus UAMH5409]|uniref:tRNA (adenine(58)-N(1))-methyltransferase catalytic subunit TRM61 n=1 Tax=Helicocarpus griseus UAMH5409 TaxID=1447875 RepID=A0A2B7XRM6_9EURO|nr:hypothetical protein AJ79_04770 [Helicocarpus griseus UAMH5409]
MARLLAPLRHTCARAYSSRATADFSVFQEGDRVYIDGKRSPTLTKPLKKDYETPVARGVLKHNDIIGKRSRDRIQAYKGPSYRVSQPTLKDYIELTPRHVTPVYPADANLIVSLLDIHVAPPASGEERREPLEILESGTGHGSLTLHLARAINAANTHPPPRPPRSQRRILELPEKKNSSVRGIEPEVKREDPDPSKENDDALQTEWDAWRAQRNAILHTVEISPTYSQHAENIVRGFRRGMYVGNVDFYVSSVETWIKEQVARRSKEGEGSPDPFLSHVILDMPSAHLRIPHVAPIMKEEAVLIVFMPSITQIGDCVELIAKQGLPFIQDAVVELGTGLSGGRTWDVRMATTKSTNDALRKEADADETTAEESESSNTAAEEASGTVRESKEGQQVLVCRPQAGKRITGGGFVGVWKKKKARVEHPPVDN